MMKKLLFTLALLVSFSSFGQTSEEYLNRGRYFLADILFQGLSKADLQDYYGAIADYTKAIEIDPNYADTYNNRGVSKRRLQDYTGAIADYTKAIEIDPNYTNAYVYRGISRVNLQDYYGACQDARKAQELGSDASPLIKVVCN